jgi:hypothetical protein
MSLRKKIISVAIATVALLGAGTGVALASTHGADTSSVSAPAGGRQNPWPGW